MPSIPNRAPIDYDELRRPYNVVRVAGGLTFAIAVVAWRS